MHLVSVVLAGGAGTRLWPVSRQALPKPFMRLGGGTLLQQAIERGQACGAQDAIIVAHQEHQFLVRGVLDELSAPPRAHCLLEPGGRNTAPAVALAALACQQQHGQEALMLVLPADHLIPDAESFAACALEAASHARQGQLVAFGVPPVSPETRFGYIEVEKTSRAAQITPTGQKALRFVEKPARAVAEQYLASGRFYWNSGMFCFSAGAILQAMKAYAPRVLAAAERAFEQAATREGATWFEPDAFGRQPDISIDHAVMEHAGNLIVVPAKFSWSDVGAWPAVARAHPADASGNTLVAAAGVEFVAVETCGTHAQAASHMPKLVALLGVRNLVVVDTPDALLVAHKDAAEKVATVVEQLKERGHESIRQPAAVLRPWGAYVTLKEEKGYKVKRITVRPGQSLSLQYHHRRAEHWVVVQGQALVQIGDETLPTLPGQYRHIPLGEKHRLSNTGKDELVLIEVQCGDYLGEDDIVRLADTYGRP